MRKGAMQLIDEAQAARDLRRHGAGGGGVRRLGREHHRRSGEPRRARGLRRQGQGRRARPRLRPRHPRRRRFLRDAAGLGRPIDRALLRAGDARRRAHHEHLSRRRPGLCIRTTSTPTPSPPPQIVYLEGYLWDPPRAKEAFLEAARIAHGAERAVALTLSDAFCVDRYRAEFLDLIRTGTVDLIFANERELHSLYETADFATALAALREDAKLAVAHPQRDGLAWW